MTLTIELPKVGRRRMAGTISLAGTAATLWIGAACQLSAPAAIPLHVACGIGIPAGVGYVTLLLMERRIARDDVRVRWGPQPEPSMRPYADLHEVHQ